MARAAESFDNPRSAQGALQAVAGFVVGALVAGVGSDSGLLRISLGAVSALGAYWLVPTATAALTAVGAPRRQRDDARTALAPLRAAEEEQPRAELVRRVESLERQLSAAQANLAFIERRRALREKLRELHWSATSPLKSLATTGVPPEQVAEQLRGSFARVAAVIHEEGAEFGIAYRAEQLVFDVPDSPTAEQVIEACDATAREIPSAMDALASGPTLMPSGDH